MQRLHRRVYLLGAAPPTLRARARAAALACAPNAFVSHRSAAWLWSLLPEHWDDVDVSVVGRNPGGRPGVRLHRVRTLRRRDVRSLHGIPLTSPATTICDLAATQPAPVLGRALSEAQVLKLLTEREMHAAVERAAPRPGAARLRTLLETEPTLTRSEAERRLLTLIRDAGLPMPQANVKLHGYTVDFLWRPERLIVEVDGFAFHAHRSAFERDRQRDARLTAAGFRVIRVTWRQLTGEPLAVIASIAQALAAAA